MAHTQSNVFRSFWNPSITKLSGGRAAMRHDYDIFERLPDGSTILLARVLGRYEAERRIVERAEHTTNQLFAMDVVTGEVLPKILWRAKEAHG
jgi:hypothetical protein